MWMSLTELIHFRKQALQGRQLMAITAGEAEF
jgi:hypothetical protein